MARLTAGCLINAPLLIGCRGISTNLEGTPKRWQFGEVVLVVALLRAKWSCMGEFLTPYSVQLLQVSNSTSTALSWNCIPYWRFLLLERISMVAAISRWLSPGSLVHRPFSIFKLWWSVLLTAAVGGRAGKCLPSYVLERLRSQTIRI